jgi:hypothetical protein
MNNNNKDFHIINNYDNYQFNEESIAKFRLVKHDRPVTKEMEKQYGELATHDIVVPCLLFFENGPTTDASGKEVEIDKEFIDKVLVATNQMIMGKKQSFVKKMIKKLTKSVEEIRVIPLIKDHDTSQVDNIVGHTEGLLYAQEIEGNYCLLANVAIEDPKTKEAVYNGLLRQTSAGVRLPSHEIYEISFVVKEALPDAGLLFSGDIKIQSI